MKKSIISVIFITTCCFNAFSQQEIVVTSAAEFVKAIGSDRTLILKEGKYNLNEAYNVTNANIGWWETYDGNELQIRDLNNLTIKSDGKVTLLAEPQYAWVLYFQYCNNISISGIIAGHVIPGGCQGGVFGFLSCNNVKIDKCELYGSGTEGIKTEYSKNLTMTNTTIRDCTYDIMTLSGSENIVFENCTFTKTGEYELINLFGCTGVTFRKCTFSENFNSDFMPYLFYIEQDCEKIALEGCRFINNNVKKFINQLSSLKMVKCKFSGNKFSDYTDDFLNKNQSRGK